MGFDRLLEDRISPAVLLAHGFSRSFHVGKHLGFDGCHVGDHSVGFAVDLKNGTTTRARHFEVRWSFLRHFSESYKESIMKAMRSKDGVSLPPGPSVVPQLRNESRNMTK